MPSVQIYPHPIFNENDLNPRPSPRNNTTTSTNNNNNNVSPTVNNNTIQEETKIDIDDHNLPLAVTINDAGILGILNGNPGSLVWAIPKLITSSLIITIFPSAGARIDLSSRLICLFGFRKN